MLGSRFPAVRVERSRASLLHRPREDGLAYPADTSRSHLASPLTLELIRGVYVIRSYWQCQSISPTLGGYLRVFVSLSPPCKLLCVATSHDVISLDTWLPSPSRCAALLPLPPGQDLDSLHSEHSVVIKADTLNASLGHPDTHPPLSLSITQAYWKGWVDRTRTVPQLRSRLAQQYGAVSREGTAITSRAGTGRTTAGRATAASRTGVNFAASVLTEL
jgi:hypothetical protein